MWSEPGSPTAWAWPRRRAGPRGSSSRVERLGEVANGPDLRQAREDPGEEPSAVPRGVAPRPHRRGPVDPRARRPRRPRRRAAPARSRPARPAAGRPRGGQALPNYEHTAVLVAEVITARFLNIIGLFNAAIPLIAIQLN